MPSDSSDPEKYSISEMMDRLKERSSEDRSNGELVTRADGTQAIKVRSRKRRSSQPEKEKSQKSRRTRAIQLIAAVVFIFVLLGSATAIVVYMNGSPYRTKITERIDKVTGATTEISTFGVTPIGATAQSVNFTWPDGGVFKKLELQGAAAELGFTSFLGQPWTGEEVTAQKGQMWVDSPDVAPGGDTAEMSEYFRFNRLRCSDFTMHFGGNGKTPALDILNSEVSLYPRSASGRPELRVTGGRLKLRQYFPEMAIDRALIGITGKQVNIVSMRLQGLDKKQGALNISGSVDSPVGGRISTLDLKVEDLPFDHLAGADMGNFLSGRIESRDLANSNFLTFDPGAVDSARLVVAFRGGFSSQLKLARLPFLIRLRRLLDDVGYENPAIESGATGILKIAASEVTLEDLRFEVKNRMMIRGSISVAANKALSGHIQVGLPAGLVQGEPRLNAAFGSAREDMRWLDIELSGTVAAPLDDFEKKVISPLGSSSAPVRPTGPTPEDAFKDLTKPR